MKFSVGYQFCEDGSLTAAILEKKEHIKEVYFSWGDIPNGRSRGDDSVFLEPMELKMHQLSELKRFKENGIELNLLLNGNCYGQYSLSRVFFNKLGDAVQFLKENAAVNSVTTTSPIIARFIKENFPKTQVRASVNMEIGEAEGLDYLAEYFDSFYLKREYNRNYKKMIAAKNWCDQNGKGLYGLANSGCLNFCSAHTFHDNLVAHESEIAQMDNAYQFEGQCRIYLENEQKRADWLRITNFIRPEDVALYEDIFDGLKLATRISRQPVKIITAYCSGRYSGNIPELLEPDHAGLFYPTVIENKKIPENFAKQVLNCDKNCKECGFCAQAQAAATVIL